MSHHLFVFLFHQLLLQITSKTNFPVAAGLASSAAGFAAIAVALGKLFDLPQSDIIRLARQGFF